MPPAPPVRPTAAPATPATFRKSRRVTFFPVMPVGLRSRSNPCLPLAVGRRPVAARPDSAHPHRSARRMCRCLTMRAVTPRYGHDTLRRTRVKAAGRGWDTPETACDGLGSGVRPWASRSRGRNDDDDRQDRDDREDPGHRARRRDPAPAGEDRTRHDAQGARRGHRPAALHRPPHRRRARERAPRGVGPGARRRRARALGLVSLALVAPAAAARLRASLPGGAGAPRRRDRRPRRAARGGRRLRRPGHGASAARRLRDRRGAPRALHRLRQGAARRAAAGRGRAPAAREARGASRPTRSPTARSCSRNSLTSA